MIQILTGDCRAVLPTLEPESIQCCVTSPPYWGLRDYGTATWEGGDSECAHRVGGEVQDNKAKGAITNGQRPGVDASRCLDCGARRIDAQLGLESTPDQYVANMVAVFRAVWRVLHKDGTLWLNLGDSFSLGVGSARGKPYKRHSAQKSGLWAGTANAKRDIGNNGVVHDGSGLKPKDLCGIPWRVAFALQADGWYLRSDIIWHKPNPMPESVTDRPTKAHEYIFLLTKQERYYYDADTIREPHQDKNGIKRFKNGCGIGTRNDGQGWCGGNVVLDEHREYNPLGRNKRSVWTIPTQSYSEAHFATFPEALVKPCILAGSKLGDTVLDPFAGSGTVGRVAMELGRKSVLIELNQEYIKFANDRTNVTPGFL